jgi:hypothetical protein
MSANFDIADAIHTHESSGQSLGFLMQAHPVQLSNLVNDNVPVLPGLWRRKIWQASVRLHCRL